MRRWLATMACAAALAGILAVEAEAGDGYGCFRVITDLNIRDSAFSSSPVIATASKGEILVKARRWCTLRGYWCAVRKGGVTGWADKEFMEKIDCPSGYGED